jgi:hypothetical protein
MILMVEDHLTRAHALLSASGTDWWTNCLGAPLLTRDMPDVQSEYSREGTAGHEMAQDCLINGREAVEYIDRMVGAQAATDDAPALAGFVVDEEWADAIQEYLDECREYMGPGWVWGVEERVSLEALDPPDHMFGTCDFWAYNAELGLLVIVDLKFGKGVAVKADDNGQVKYYALGRLLGLPVNMPVRSILCVIVQPRRPFGQHVMRIDVDPLELMAWSLWLLDRARLALTPGQPLTPGSWCHDKFCKLDGRCAAQAAAHLALAQDEFALAELEETAPRLPDPRLLTSAQVAAILDRAPLFEQFISAVREVAKDGIHRGWMDVPGWMVTPREAREKWASADEKAIAGKLVKVYGLSEDEAWKRKVSSPAQARAAIVAGLRSDGMKKKDAEPLARDLLSKITIKESSGVNLVPVAMNRIPAGVRGSEFDMLEAPADQTT